MDQVNALLQLDHELGLAMPEAPDEHRRSLLIDGMSVNLWLSDDAATVHMEAPVGSVDCHDASLLYTLLEANHEAGGTGGGVLCIDAQDRVMLSQSVSVANLELGGIAKPLGRFVDHVEYWRARVNPILSTAGNSIFLGMLV